MKRLFFAFLLAGLSSATLGLTSANAQNIEVIQTIYDSGDGIINSTSTVVEVFSVPVSPGYLTLPTSPATGRSFTIVNRSSGTLLLSTVVWKDETLDAAVAALSESPDIIDPLLGPNRVTIYYNGTKWMLK